MSTMEPVDEGTAEPCPDYVGLVVRAADGGLDPSDRARLDTHLGNCARCREAVETQRTVHVMLAEAFVVEASPRRVERVLARVQAETRWVDRQDYRRWTYRLVPVAAGLIAAAYLTVSGSGVNVPDGDVAGADVAVSATDEATTVASLDWRDVSPLLTTDEGDEIAVADVLGGEARP
jgi:predicted anti-sigma-YlaC factor YlaD